MPKTTKFRTGYIPKFFYILAGFLVYVFEKIGPESKLFDSPRGYLLAYLGIIVITKIIARIGWMIALFLKKRNQKKRDKRAIKIMRDVEAGKKHTYSLYLRGFHTTGVTPLPIEPAGGILWKNPDPYLDFEALLAESVEYSAPLIALGKPGEQIGAGRVQCDEKSWQEKLMLLARRAMFIFVLPSESAGTRWEIEWILKNQLTEKSILLMPYEYYGFRMKIWDYIANWLGRIGLWLPIYQTIGLRLRAYQTKGLKEKWDNIANWLGRIGLRLPTYKTKCWKEKWGYIASEFGKSGIQLPTYRSEGMMFTIGNIGEIGLSRILNFEINLRHFCKHIERLSNGIGDQLLLQDPEVFCHDCGSSYRLSEYRPDAPAIFCSLCKQRLPRFSNSIEACNLYFKGRHCSIKGTEEALKKSLRYFQEMKEKDPSCAKSYAEVAGSLIKLMSYDYISPREAYPKVKAVATKALDIDNTLAEAHASLAFVKNHFDLDWTSAEKSYKKAVDLDPDYATAHHLYAYYLASIGKLKDCLAEVKRAQELDSLSLVIISSVGTLLYYARQYDLAIEQCNKTLELNPNFAYAHAVLGRVYLQKSMFEEAINEFQIARTLTGGTGYLSDLGYANAVMGMKSKALKVIKILEELSKEKYVSAFERVPIYIGLGEKNKAFRWLKNSYENREYSIVYIKIDPRLDDIRSDQRFKALLTKIGLDK